MSRLTFGLLLAASGLGASLGSPANAVAEPIPLFFQENRGQWPDEVRFGVIDASAVTLVGPRGLIARFPDGRTVRFEGPPARRAQVVGEERLPGYVNHFLGRDPSRWRSHTPIYRRVRARDLAAGVDLVVREVDHRLEVLVEAKPGAEIDKLRLTVRGHDQLGLTPDGALWVQVGGDRMNWSAPIAYQEKNGLRVRVPVRWAVARASIGFEVGPHDPEHPLIIDPILSYAVQVPGASNVWGVAATPNGQAQLAAEQSTSFGSFVTTPGAYQTTEAGGNDMLLLRIDPALSGPSSLIWATYLGGAGEADSPADVAVSPSGDVAVVGRPSGTFPMVNAVDDTRFGSDGVLAVLSNDGAQLRFSTYLSYHPGAPQLFVHRVAMDARGYAYVSGRIDGNWTVRNAILPAQTNTGYRAFFAVYDPSTGTELNGLYLTELAATVEGLDTDSFGNVVGAFVSTPNVYITPGGVGAAGNDIALVKIGPIGETNPAQVIFSTSLGGTGFDQVEGLVLDANDNIYVSGLTPAQDFITTPGAYRTTLPAGTADFFVTKLNSTATARIYSTFLGNAANGPIRTDDLALDSNGRVYLISGGGPFTPTACGTTLGPALTVLSADGSARDFATALGNGVPTPFSVAVLPNGQAVVVGAAGAGVSLPPLNAFQVGSAGGYFVSLPTPTACTDLSLNVTGPASGATGLNLSFDVNVTDVGTGATNLRLTIAPSLPASLVSISSGSCTGAGPFECQLGNLAANGTTTLQVVLRPSQVGTLSTNFTLSSDTFDTNQANNTDSVVSVITAGSSPCGSVTYAGECQGRVLRYCEGEGTPSARLVTVNCATELYPPGVSGECTLIDPVYGHDCTAAPGDACAFADGQGGTYVSFCRGDRPGCVYEDGGQAQALCTEQIGPCTPPASGQVFTPICAGSVLVRSCQVNQPIGFDCASIGGRCQDATCVGLPVGARCDATELLCAPGLTCDGASGVCVDPNTLCDPRTFEPNCQGTVLETCDRGDGVKVRRDCAARGQAATCGAPYSCSDQGTGRCANLGLGCVTPAGNNECDLLNDVYCGVGRSCYATYDAARGAGGRCAQAATSCGPGELHVGCVGEVATFCLGGQGAVVAEPAGFDCESFGGTCGLEPTRGDPVCYGREGARCRSLAVDPNTPFQCEPGQMCSGGETDFGRCVPDPNAPSDGGVTGDSGVPNNDGGAASDGGVDLPGPAPAEEGCGCRALPYPGASTPWVGMISWLALGLGSVRRRGPRQRRPEGSAR